MLTDEELMLLRAARQRVAAAGNGALAAALRNVERVALVQQHLAMLKEATPGSPAWRSPPPRPGLTRRGNG